MATTKGHIARSGLAGLLAGLAGIGVSELVAALLAAPSPLVAVGEQVIDLAPPALKDFAVSRFGTADKPLLLAVLLIGLAGVSALAGIIALRRPRLGLVVVASIGLVGLVVALIRSASPLPAFAGAIAAVGALAFLLSAWRNRVSDEPVGFDRRRFLVAALATGAVGVGGGVIGRLMSAGSSGPVVAVPRPSSPAGTLPGSVAPRALQSTTPFFTPNKGFYRVDINLAVPRVDPRTWRLRLHGLVRRPLELSFEQLLRRRLVERDITLTCVSNEVGGPYVGNARWIGVPVADLLAEAGVRGGADAVKSTAVDGFTIGTPLSALTDGRDALLAVAMNGEPIPAEHGFPVRMVVPGLYGYVSATKWLVDLEVTRFSSFEAYWTSRGWAARAPIKTASRIDVPRPFARLSPGRVVVAGVAWAQHRGISRVEVRVDGGPWQPARLATSASIDTWRQWVWTWDATPGNHTLEVRATDATGTTQTSRRVPPRPDGSTGWHSVAVMVSEK